MKFNKKARTIVLGIILIALIALGIGMLALLNGGENDNTGLDSKAPDVQDPQAEQLGYIQDGQVYTEALISFKYPDQNLKPIIRYNDNIVTWTNSEKGTDIIDVNSGELIFDVPDRWYENEQVASAVTLDSAGNLYGLMLIKNENKVVVEINYKDNSKKYETVTLNGVSSDGHNDQYIFAENFMVDNNYYYICFESNGQRFMQIFTKTGELYVEYKDMIDFDIDGQGGLYILDNYRQITKYDVETKMSEYSFYPNVSDGSRVFLCLAVERKNNLLYLAANENVQIYSGEDGAFIKTAMDLSKSALGITGFIKNMGVDSGHNLYLLTYKDLGSGGQSGWEMYKYGISKDLRRDMPCTLTVSAPYKDAYMTSVIAQFESDNPEQKVKYDYEYNNQMDFYNNSDADGYFARMSTKLMAGDVGDIVMTGGHWWDTYQIFTKDIFKDLSPMIKRDAAYKELDKKLIDGVTIDGKAMGLPFAANYCYAQINTERAKEMGITLDWNTATWSDILALNERFEGTDKYLFSMFKTPERAFVRMLISNMPDIIDVKNKKIDLRQQWFLDLIEQWKQALQSPNFAKFNDEMGLTEDALICIDMKTDNEYISSALYWIADFCGVGGKIMQVSPLFSGEKHSNRTAISEDMYSITAGSKNAEMAWKLLSTGLSADKQVQHILTNRPINVTARDVKTKAGVLETGYKGGAKLKAAQKAADELETVYNSVDCLYDMRTIKEDLFKPLLKYFDGTSTLDEALKTAEHDIWIRLNE